MQTKTKVERVQFPEAARRLDISPRKLNYMLAKDLFTVKQDCEGGDRYLLSDELDLWIEEVGTPDEMEEKLRDFRIKKKRLKK